VHVETEWAAGTGNSMAIIGSRFTNNTSGVAGGALLVNGQNLQLQDTLFERNKVRRFVCRSCRSCGSCRSPFTSASNKC
jgi:dihydroxyacid dehydratase/phosphogluconate dehydratase